MPKLKTTAFSWPDRNRMSSSQWDWNVTIQKKDTVTRCFLPLLQLLSETLSPSGCPGAGMVPSELTAECLRAAGYTGAGEHCSTPYHYSYFFWGKIRWQFLPLKKSPCNILWLYLGHKERSFSLFYLRRHTCVSFLKEPPPRWCAVYISQSLPGSCAHILWERHWDRLTEPCLKALITFTWIPGPGKWFAWGTHSFRLPLKISLGLPYNWNVRALGGRRAGCILWLNTPGFSSCTLSLRQPPCPSPFSSPFSFSTTSPSYWIGVPYVHISLIRLFPFSWILEWFQETQHLSWPFALKI